MKNGTAACGCLLTPWRAWREIEEHEAAVVVNGGVCGCKRVYASEWLFSKSLQLIFPIAFLTERDVSLC